MRTQLTLSLIFALFLSSFIANAQNNLIIGAQTSLTYDRFKIEDPGGQIKSIRLSGASWGFLIAREFGDFFSIQTGLGRKYYQMGYGYQVNAKYNGFRTSSLTTWEIPLNASIRYNLYDEIVYLKINGGGVLSINSNYNSGYAWGSSGVIARQDTIRSSYIANMDLRRTFFLVQAGLGAELVLNDYTRLSLMGNYFFGYREVARMDITYDINSEQSKSAVARSEGEYWNLNLALKFVIPTSERRMRTPSLTQRQP